MCAICVSKYIFKYVGTENTYWFLECNKYVWVSCEIKWCMLAELYRYEIRMQVYFVQCTHHTYHQMNSHRREQKFFWDKRKYTDREISKPTKDRKHTQKEFVEKLIFFSRKEPHKNSINIVEMFCGESNAISFHFSFFLFLFYLCAPCMWPSLCAFCRMCFWLVFFSLSLVCFEEQKIPAIHFSFFCYCYCISVWINSCSCSASPLASARKRCV